MFVSCQAQQRTAHGRTNGTDHLRVRGGSWPVHSWLRLGVVVGDWGPRLVRAPDISREAGNLDLIGEISIFKKC